MRRWGHWGKHEAVGGGEHRVTLLPPLFLRPALLRALRAGCLGIVQRICPEGGLEERFRRPQLPCRGRSLGVAILSIPTPAWSPAWSSQRMGTKPHRSTAARGVATTLHGFVLGGSRAWLKQPAAASTAVRNDSAAEARENRATHVASPTMAAPVALLPTPLPPGGLTQYISTASGAPQRSNPPSQYLGH